VLWLACELVAIANVFNIGADLGGMAEATEMMTGVRAYYWAPCFAALILGLLLWTSYRTMARIFKWLTMVLFAYVITAFLAHPDWRAVIRATFVPHIEYSKDYLAVLVGILGTTISPYLFFWQAAQEVEEDRDAARPRWRNDGAPRTGSSLRPNETSSLECCFQTPSCISSF
jgi:Mn2+/Fe2+ NRAMP family transporter